MLMACLCVEVSKELQLADDSVNLYSVEVFQFLVVYLV